MKEELFKEEKEFFCGICGKGIEKDDEIDEELCQECLKAILH